MRELYFTLRFVGIVLFFLALPSLVLSQGKDTTDIAKKKDGAAKQEDKSNILVVPFPPQMYTAFGDQYICQKSKMTPGELSDMIRRSLTSTLIYNMSDLYNVTEPPSDLRNQNSDLSVLYQITKFKNQFKKLKSYFKGYPDRKVFEALAPSYIKWGTDCVNDISQRPNRLHHKFVRAEIIKDSIFESICKRHNAHFVLMITQFEMTTRFKNCSDLQNQVFQRDFFIHYSLFDKSGKYIDGGVVGTTYQSSTNDINKILEKNLGTLTGMIIEEIRRKF